MDGKDIRWSFTNYPGLTYRNFIFISYDGDELERVIYVTKVKFEGQGKKPQHKGDEKLTQADIERLMGMRSGRRDSKLVKVYK